LKKVPNTIFLEHLPINKKEIRQKASIINCNLPILDPKPKVSEKYESPKIHVVLFLGEIVPTCSRVNLLTFSVRNLKNAMFVPPPPDCQMFCAVFSQLINSIFDDERTVEVWNLVNEGKKNRDDRF
jgi:hypothetical protein